MMILPKLRQSIRHLRARVFGFASADQPYGPKEMDELATSIVEYGRMRQEHYGSRSVVLGAGELAMRLRETIQTIVKALEVLRVQAALKKPVLTDVGDCSPRYPRSKRWTEHRKTW